MTRSIVAFISGLIFALGLGISGMTQPQNVIGFLDLTNWNPSLLFVMAGAVTIHGLSFFIIRNRPSPLLDTTWHIPKRKDITPKLLIGATIFGIGWGLGGYCPGPGVTAIASGQLGALTFVASMVTGMFVYSYIERNLPLRN